MGSDVGQIFPTASLHRDHSILYALVCEKALSGTFMFFLILTAFILIDYLIHTCIDTISMELSIFKGLLFKLSIRCVSVPNSCFHLSKQCIHNLMKCHFIWGFIVCVCFSYSNHRIKKGKMYLFVYHMSADTLCIKSLTIILVVSLSVI